MPGKKNIIIDMRLNAFRSLETTKSYLKLILSLCKIDLYFATGAAYDDTNFNIYYKTLNPQIL